jgi:outer membrane biosynthesis protein TonB
MTNDDTTIEPTADVEPETPTLDSIQPEPKPEPDVTPIPKAKDKAAVDAAAKSTPKKETVKPARAAKGVKAKTATPRKRAGSTKEAAPKGPRRAAKLAAAEKASEKYREARAVRDAAITAAREDGFVLRELSEATGYANQTIRRIIGGGSPE